MFCHVIIYGLLQQSTNTKIVLAAKQQVGVTTTYDPAYVRLKYPNGDVPMTTGVCTDVVVRSLRAIRIDLQKEIFQDRTKNPRAYAGGKADPNIDHRRVVNQMIFFKRRAKTVSDSFKPGDFVAWELINKRLHIGVVSNSKSPRGIPLVIHNIGAGTQEEDVLNAYRMIGHYRW